MLKRYQQLDNKVSGRLQFKSANDTSVETDCEILDRFKNQLLSENVSREAKGRYFYFLQRFLRDTQKDRCKPNGSHYAAVDIGDVKKHLEHPIPQNKILAEYMEGNISALEAIHMPLCVIADSDKHTLQGEWEQNATWTHPFKRYRLAGFTKQIKNLRGEVIDPNTWSIEDHFRMLGIDNLIKDNTIQA